MHASSFNFYGSRADCLPKFIACVETWTTKQLKQSSEKFSSSHEEVVSD